MPASTSVPRILPTATRSGTSSVSTKHGSEARSSVSASAIGVSLRFAEWRFIGKPWNEYQVILRASETEYRIQAERFPALLSSVLPLLLVSLA